MISLPQKSYSNLTSLKTIKPPRKMLRLLVVFLIPGLFGSGGKVFLLS